MLHPRLTLSFNPSVEFLLGLSEYPEAATSSLAGVNTSLSERADDDRIPINRELWAVRLLG